MLTRIISTSAPAPLGHYEQAVLHGNTLYVSGQLGVAKDARDPATIGVGDQIEFALSNVERIARLAGATREAIIKVTIYVTDIAHWEEANRAYAVFFGGHKPARSVVPCPGLHLGAKVEIDAILAIG